jgi:hypothetical protein
MIFVEYKTLHCKDKVFLFRAIISALAYVATLEVCDSPDQPALFLKRYPHFGRPYDLVVSVVAYPSIQKVPGSIPTTANSLQIQTTKEFVSFMTTNYLKTELEATPETSCLVKYMSLLECIVPYLVLVLEWCDLEPKFYVTKLAIKISNVSVISSFPRNIVDLLVNSICCNILRELLVCVLTGNTIPEPDWTVFCFVLLSVKMTPSFSYLQLWLVVVVHLRHEFFSATSSLTCPLDNAYCKWIQFSGITSEVSYRLFWQNCLKCVLEC